MMLYSPSRPGDMERHPDLAHFCVNDAYQAEDLIHRKPDVANFFRELLVSRIRDNGISERYLEIEFISFPAGLLISRKCYLPCFRIAAIIVSPGRSGCHKKLAKAFSYDVCPEHRESCQRRMVLHALPVPELALLPPDGAFRRCHCLFHSPAPPGHHDHICHSRLDGRLLRNATEAEGYNLVFHLVPGFPFRGIPG